MKNLVIGIGMMMIMLLVSFSLLSLSMNRLNKNEVEQSIRLAIHQTLKECKDIEKWAVIEHNYGSQVSAKAERGFSKQDSIMAERFKSNLKKLIKDSGKVYVKVVESDYQEGILDVEVEYYYSNFGMEKAVKVRKMVIWENENKVS